jgi:hypothetical protein
MQNKLILMTAVSLFAASGIAFGQAGTVGSGSMGVTATVVGTLNLTFITDAAGLAVTGTGTATASLPFGNVQMFGAAAVTGLTQTLTGLTAFTIATPVDIRADISNSTSTTYSLAAALATADAINTWTVGGVNISSGASTVVAATAGYAANTPYVFAITIPATATAGLITNTVNFTATSN